MGLKGSVIGLQRPIAHADWKRGFMVRPAYGSTKLAVMPFFVSLLPSYRIGRIHWSFVVIP